MYFRFPVIILVLLAGAGAGAADKPAPATITGSDGKVMPRVWVTGETVDAIEYFIGDPNGPHSDPAPTKRDKIRSVDYEPDKETIDWIKANGALGRGEFDQAARYFLAATDSANFFWVRERSYIEAARAYAKAKKSTEAIKALDALRTRVPKSALLPTSSEVRLEIALAANDRAALDAALADLKANAAAWGPRAQFVLAKYTAENAMVQKKPDEAAAGLAKYLDSIKVEDQPEEYAELLRRSAQIMADKPDQALALYQRLMFLPVAGATQADAHLACANILKTRSGKADLVAALDQALTARALRGAEGKTRGEATKLARDLSTKLEAEAKTDPAFAKELEEYRSYLK